MATNNIFNNSTDYRDGFCANLSTTQSNVTGDGTAYTIIFDSEVYDRAGVYDNTSGIFTVPRTGFYYIQAQALVTGINSGSTTGELVLISTPKTILLSRSNPYGNRSGAGSYLMNGSVLMYLSATDTVYVQITLTGGTKVSDLSGASSLYTFFSAVRLG